MVVLFVPLVVLFVPWLTEVIDNKRNYLKEKGDITLKTPFFRIKTIV
jgi:hypothetical protein